MSLCKELKNLGAATCKNPMQIAKRLIFVPELGSAGTENMIATAAGVTKTALQALFDAADKVNRYYPTPLIENVENVRAETTFHEFNSGAKLAVKQGTKHFVGYLPLEFPQLLGGFKAWEGQNFGIYIIDKDGNFIYQTDAATKLKVKPFKVDGNSFVASYVEPTDTEVAMVKFEFDYSVSVKDELMRYIDADDLDFNGLGADVYPLMTVIGMPTSPLAASVRLTPVTEYGEPVTGLTSTEISCVDNKGVSVTVSDVDEFAWGYTITLSGPAVETECYLSITKPRYDFSAINATAFQVDFTQE